PVTGAAAGRGDSAPAAGGLSTQPRRGGRRICTPAGAALGDDACDLHSHPENPTMSEAPHGEERPTEARLMHMVFPDHTNHLGTLFGGQALAWMDMASFIAASRYARTTVVTARSEQVDFNQPIHKGDLVEVVARLAK